MNLHDALNLAIATLEKEQRQTHAIELTAARIRLGQFRTMLDLCPNSNALEGAAVFLTLLTTLLRDGEVRR